MAGKPIRLAKAAGELNVGIPTIVEFLGSKGIVIDSNPTARLEPEHFEMLSQEFAADQSMKEQSKAALRREKRESLSIKDKPLEDQSPATVVEDEDEGEINLEEIKRQVLGEVQAKVSAPVVEEAAPIVKEIAATAPLPEPSENKVNVIGKIDLDAINQRTRPDKKKEKFVQKQPAAQPVVAKPAPVQEVPKPVVAPQAPAAAVVPEAPISKAPVIETIRAARQTLTGPTVLGKIELPVERQRTPVASSSEDANSKRKRKRIKKVEVSPTPNSTAKPKVEKVAASAPDIQKEIKDTLARLSNQGGKSKASKNRRQKRDNYAQRRQEEMAMAELEEKTLKITEFVTVSELASMMNIQPTQVISVCMSLGIFASINQRLDAETIQIVADEFGFETEFISAELQDAITVIEDLPEDLIARPPIITVMGHVDHGKTSLLDRIRNANVTEGEAGGITQHIGAYSVTLKDSRKMTFLDTPGHEAFTAMRARGAQVTDVAIIVIAADDYVMPQTVEAINHAQAAQVPIVFAINKIDKPGANPEKIREQLAQMNILVEDWGGKYQIQEVAAKLGKNIDLLLEKVLLEAELLELKANPDKRASGTIIESELDKGRGYVTTMIILAGTLRVGDVVLAGPNSGRVKALFNERGAPIKEAGPSMSVQMLGLSGAPSSGDKFNVMSDEREAREIANKRQQLQREQGIRTHKHITLDEIGRRIAIGDFKELNIIVKGDVDGSVEALSDSLLKLSTEKIQINIIHKSVGQVTEGDVLLASASNAIIIGFQVRPSASARKLAENEEIDMRFYSIIYKAIEEIKAAMEGMLAPEFEEKIVCNVEVRDVFKITKVGTVAGCYVLDGKITRHTKIRLIRDGIVVYSGDLGSLKRFKDDVKEVATGYECGLNIHNFNDIKEGDIIEGYENVEIKRKL